MGYFPVRYDSRVVMYVHKMFIRLPTVLSLTFYLLKCEELISKPAATLLKSVTYLYLIVLYITECITMY